MAYTLLSIRVVVEPDVGKTDRGMVVEGFGPSTIDWTYPPPPDPPVQAKVYHNHVVFVTNMAQLINQGGTDYYSMHRDAILGYLEP